MPRRDSTAPTEELSRGIQWVVRCEVPCSVFAPIGGGLFVLGIVFGLLTAIVGGWDLTQPWLIIGYVLSAIVLVLAFTYFIPTANRLKALIDASTDDEPSAELRAAIDAPMSRVMNVIDAAIWLALIFDMVVKPFS